MAWPVMVLCVLAQVRPSSDSWRGFQGHSSVYPYILPLFKSFYPHCNGSIHAEWLLVHSLVTLKYLVFVLLW